jgi:hypothetical protein
MAETHSVEEAKQKFEKLPAEIKKLLYSEEMAIILQKVGEKNQLHVDQVDALYTETGQVMLGFATTQEFVEDIVDILKVDSVKANAIAKDINDMLFIKIRDAMKQPVSVPRPSEQVVPATPAPLSSVIPINKTPEPTPAAEAPVTASSGIPPMAVTKATEIHPADMMLTQKTVTTTAPAAPAQKVEPLGRSTITGEAPKPGEYKADPYRELPI